MPSPINGLPCLIEHGGLYTGMQLFLWGGAIRMAQRRSALPDTILRHCKGATLAFFFRSMTYDSQTHLQLLQMQKLSNFVPKDKKRIMRGVKNAFHSYLLLRTLFQIFLLGRQRQQNRSKAVWHRADRYPPRRLKSGLEIKQKK